jgi:hydroxylamine reductase
MRTIQQGRLCRQSGLLRQDRDVADLQDVLLRVMQGVSVFAARAAERGARDEVVDAFTPYAWFTTLTNVNFDAERFTGLIARALELRAKARALAQAAGADLAALPEPAVWNPGTTASDFALAAPMASILRFTDRDGPSISGLRDLVLYGLKGTAAYSEHARVLGKEEASVSAEFHRIAAFLATDPTDIDALLRESLAVGALNMQVMELLDAANTGRFGHPEPTQVRMSPVSGKAILVSGHDRATLKPSCARPPARASMCTPMVSCCRPIPIRASSNMRIWWAIMAAPGRASRRILLPSPAPS